MMKLFNKILKFNFLNSFFFEYSMFRSSHIESLCGVLKINILIKLYGKNLYKCLE